MLKRNYLSDQFRGLHSIETIFDSQAIKKNITDQNGKLIKITGKLVELVNLCIYKCIYIKKKRANYSVRHGNLQNE